MVDQAAMFPAQVVDKPITAPDMSIVLVCWNNKEYLDPCLRSLYDGNLKHTI